MNEAEAIRSYSEYVRWMLEYQKWYPEYALAKELEGKVKLQFSVRANGKVVNAKIIESTGHFVFGHAALQTLRGIGKLPPFPNEIQRCDLLMELPITYQLEG